MSSIGELFGFPGEQNDTPFDPTQLDASLDRILHDPTRPVPGAPDGYVRPGTVPPVPQGDGVGAAGGVPVPPAPVAPETPAAPPPFAWPAGPASAFPPAAPATPPAAPPAPPAAPPAPPAPPPGPPAAPAGIPDPFAGLTDLERYEAALVVQALRDPERAAGVRRAYIGAPEPIGGVPAAPPPAAPPFAIGMPPAAPPAAAPPAPLPLPEGVDEGSPEALIIRTQQEQARQLEEIRQGVQQRDVQTEQELTIAAAGSAVQAFTARYGTRLTQPEIDWICQMAGHQKLPDAFRTSNPALTREQAFDQALEFQLRSTDSLFTKIVAGPPGAPATAPPGAPPATPPAQPAPVVYPGQTPEADARHRYLTALSNAASPSGEAPVQVPLRHRPDGKLDEPSRMELVRQMTAGGTMGELMGPN